MLFLTQRGREAEDAEVVGVGVGVGVGVVVVVGFLTQRGREAEDVEVVGVGFGEEKTTRSPFPVPRSPMFHVEQSTLNNKSFEGLIDICGHAGRFMLFHVEQHEPSRMATLPFQEKRGNGLSLPWLTVFDQLIEATWSRGGVPVFSRKSSNPNDFSESERGIPPGRPAPPLTCASCPMKMTPFRAVPAVMTTVLARSGPFEAACMPTASFLAESVMTATHSSCSRVRLG